MKERRVRVGALQQIGWAHAFLRYMRDPSASLLGKVFVALAATYVVMPFDAIPDALPIVGWLDDLGVVSATAIVLTRVLRRYRVGT